MARRGTDKGCLQFFFVRFDRAISRGREQLPPGETIRAYRTIFFPAQEIPFQHDNPKALATLIVNNDPRLGPVRWDA